MTLSMHVGAEKWTGPLATSRCMPPEATPSAATRVPLIAVHAAGIGRDDHNDDVSARGQGGLCWPGRWLN